MTDRNTGRRRRARDRRMEVFFEGGQGAEGAVTPYVDGLMDDL